MHDYFSIMPVEIFMDDRLTKTDLRVLGAIMSWRNKTTNLCHPSREQISKRCRLPLCKISTATSHLVDLGWLEKKGNGGRSSHCVYKFSIPDSIKYIEKEKLFIVYKTVNTITGQFYIGLHETLNINDGYYGSNQIVQSWDKNILNMDVLFYASDREEAALVEVDLIKNSIDDPLCVNKAVLLNEIHKNKTVTDSVTINEETVTDSVTKTVTNSVTKTVTDSVRGKKLKETKNKLKEITLHEFFNQCRENKESPIPGNDPIFDYAEKVGIPFEFLRLGWIHFKTLHRPDKKQKDWRAVFRDYVKRNFLKVWFIDNEGKYCLTTLGKQLEREVA